MADERDPELERLLRQARVLAWVALEVLAVAAVVMLMQGQVSAFVAVMGGWGLTLWGAMRLRRLRRRR